VPVRHTDHRDTKKAGHRCPAFSGWDFSLGLTQERFVQAAIHRHDLSGCFGESVGERVSVRSAWNWASIVASDSSDFDFE
jgi:hypothetical protein